MSKDGARWLREMRKGTARLAILHILQAAPTYGYDILQRMGKVPSLQSSEAAIYPALHDLEKAGALEAHWQPTGDGIPPRKYYRLTKEGKQMLEEMTQTWHQFRNDVDTFLEAKP